jgi:hypothetical protein
MDAASTEFTTPSWFDQRQGKAEAKGPYSYQLTAPNLKPAFISVQPGGAGLWSASLRMADDGPPVAVTEGVFPGREEAWEAAFELYRQHVVV